MIKKMIATPFFNEQVRQAYLFSCFYTSISFDFSRAEGFFFFSSLAAASCARMDGFFCFCVVFRGCLGFLA